MAEDPIAVADLSVAVDPIEAADQTAVGDRYGEAAHTAAQNVVAAVLSAVADRYGAAAHTAVPNAVAVDPTAVVDRYVVVVRSAPVDLNAVPNVAMNAVHFFLAAQLDRVSLILLAVQKVRIAETHLVARKCRDAKAQFAADYVKAFRRRHSPGLVEQLGQAFRRRHSTGAVEQLGQASRCRPSDAMRVMRPSTELSAMTELVVPAVRHQDLLAKPGFCLSIFWASSHLKDSKYPDFQNRLH